MTNTAAEKEKERIDIPGAEQLETGEDNAFETARKKLAECEADDGYFILFATFRPEDAKNEKVRGIVACGETSDDFLVAVHERVVDVIKTSPTALLKMLMRLAQDKEAKGEGNKADG